MDVGSYNNWQAEQHLALACKLCHRNAFKNRESVILILFSTVLRLI